MSRLALVLIPQHLLFPAFSYVFLDEIEKLMLGKDPPLTIYQKKPQLRPRVTGNNVVNSDYRFWIRMLQ